MPVARVVLAVDGNAIVHRAFHAQAVTGFRSADGRPPSIRPESYHLCPAYSSGLPGG